MWWRGEWYKPKYREKGSNLTLCINHEAGRKRGMDGIAYAVRSSDVIDMMRRYDVAVVYESR